MIFGERGLKQMALVPEAEVAVAQALRHAQQGQVDEALDALGAT